VNSTTPTSIPSTYTELRKGIRTAQALYEADYSDQYVYDSLIKTGYDQQQTEWIMKSAELENVTQRKKTSLLGVIIFGAAWAIIFTILYISADDPEATSLMRRQVKIPVSYWIIAGGVFIASVVNYIYAAMQVARVKKKLPVTPDGIGENEPL
jgi:hypothetical protein